MHLCFLLCIHLHARVCVCTLEQGLIRFNPIRNGKRLGVGRCEYKERQINRESLFDLNRERCRKDGGEVLMIGISPGLKSKVTV